MKKAHALKLAGSPTALAEILGITVSAISQWGTDEDIPEGREWQLRAIKPEWFARDKAPADAKAKSKAKA